MKYLVFDSQVSGHHLEYIHHIYEYAVSHQDDSFLFLVHQEFAKVKDKFLWIEKSNIRYQFLTEKEQLLCNKSNLLISAWHKSTIIKRSVNENGINMVLLIMFMHLMPFLPWMLKGSVKIRGILYRLFFYEGTTIKGFRFLLEKFRYWLFLKSRNVDKVLVLNDKDGTEYLNKMFKTNKFSYLPDPIPEIKLDNSRNIRNDLKISDDDIFYLHFGGLDSRKGTLEILKAIKLMPEDSLLDKVFVFAGRVSSFMRDEFYSLVNECKNKSRILVYDEFCSYDFLFQLCAGCDYVLIPYKNPNQSSGVIGYASFFKKPVIGPANGLLGQLIKEYHLGISLEGVKSLDIVNALKSKSNISVPDLYSRSHTIDDFVNYLFL